MRRRFGFFVNFRIALNSVPLTSLKTVMRSSSSTLRILFLFCFLLLFSAANGQKAEEEAQKDFVRKKQFVGGAFLHSNGWGLELSRGDNITADKKRMISLGFANMKHPKEFKSYNPYYDDAKGYIYGKLNAFYVFRPNIGIKNELFEKLRPGGVKVSYDARVGPSLGVLKPIYLKIGYPDVPYQVIREERYDPDEHRIDNIYGRAPWSKGLGDMKLHPGIFGKFGMNFEYAGDEERVQAIETGLMVDAFFQRIPIMAVEEVDGVSNPRVFLNLYVCLKYGKKYYR